METEAARPVRSFSLQTLLLVATGGCLVLGLYRAVPSAFELVRGCIVISMAALFFGFTFIGESRPGLGSICALVGAGWGLLVPTWTVGRLRDAWIYTTNYVVLFAVLGAAIGAAVDLALRGRNDTDFWRLKNRREGALAVFAAVMLCSGIYSYARIMLMRF